MKKQYISIEFHGPIEVVEIPGEKVSVSPSAITTIIFLCRFTDQAEA